MKKILVVGLGFFGRQLAVSLSEKGAEVVAVDNDKGKVEEVADKVAYAMRLDATDERALANLGIDGIDLGIACIGESFEANLLATVNMKALGIGEVIGRGSTDIQCKILKAVGVEKVIRPEWEAAQQFALKLVYGDALETIPLAGGHVCATVAAPRVVCDKTLAELNLRAKHGLNLISVQRAGSHGDAEEIVNPGADQKLLEGDKLYVVGLEKDVRRFAGLKA